VRITGGGRGGAKTKTVGRWNKSKELQNGGSIEEGKAWLLEMETDGLGVFGGGFSF